MTEKLEDPSQLGKTRKDIARIKTVLRQRRSRPKACEAGSKRRSRQTVNAPPEAGGRGPTVAIMGIVDNA